MPCPHLLPFQEQLAHKQSIHKPIGARRHQGHGTAIAQLRNLIISGLPQENLSPREHTLSTLASGKCYPGHFCIAVFAYSMPYRIRGKNISWLHKACYRLLREGTTGGEKEGLKIKTKLKVACKIFYSN